MPDYRRNFVAGGTYFFTLITSRRRPLFRQDSTRKLLKKTMLDCFERRPVQVVAMVLMPEHLHTLWTLPPGDSDYSTRWRIIKNNFTTKWRAAINHRAKQESAVWQPRFWEHTIRDEADLEAHFDYIHFNPVKHGEVDSVHKWPWSTFHRWVESGH